MVVGKKSLASRIRIRRGTAVVEFALILPLLALTMLASVDFGRFGHSDVAVINAARVGAGYAADHPPTTGTLAKWQSLAAQAVKEEISPLGSASLIAVSAPYTDQGRVLVKVTVEYKFKTFFKWPGIPQNITIHREAVMRILQ